jgi:endonuclease III
VVSRCDRVLEGLEKHYGKPRTSTRSDPYTMIVVAQCGYPASEAACARGFAALRERVGAAPADILRVPARALVEAMRAGGIVPELRAERLRAIASTVADEYGGDLGSALRAATPAQAKKILKTFPTIADAGAEKVLLFARLSPVMAIPSNATQVPLRLGFGQEGKSWGVGYKSAQRALEGAIPEAFEPRIRAHLLFKKHGETICKRSKPACDKCPVAEECAYFARAGEIRRATKRRPPAS